MRARVTSASADSASALAGGLTLRRVTALPATDLEIGAPPQHLEHAFHERAVFRRDLAGRVVHSIAIEVNRRWDRGFKGEGACNSRDILRFFRAVNEDLLLSAARHWR